MRSSGIAMTNVWTCSGRVKPGSTCLMAMKVRTISPETISNVSASATCPTTRTLRVRCRPGPSPAERPPSLSAMTRGRPNCRTATASRTGSRCSTDTESVNNRTVPSIVDVVDTRQLCRRDDAQQGGPQPGPAPLRPARPRRPAPRSPTSIARAMRPRLAPSAVRRANSSSRPSARTRWRLRTLPQATSSTMPTAARRIHENAPGRRRPRRRPAAARPAAARAARRRAAAAQSGAPHRRWPVPA